jgi:hypothetical protein
MVLYFEMRKFSITQQDLLFELVGCSLGLDIADSTLISFESEIHVFVIAAF